MELGLKKGLSMAALTVLAVGVAAAPAVAAAGAEWVGTYTQT